MMEPDLQGYQSGNVELPEGAVLNDAGQPVYADTGKPLDVIRRPGLIPFARTPDGIQPVMPKTLDLLSNVMSPLAAGRVPVKAGEMVLGSGAVRTAKEAEKAAEPFYSTLERAVVDAKMQKATPEQWMGYLRNQPGVKPDELEWRLEEALKQQPKKQLAKEEVAQLLAQNKVEINEVERGRKAAGHDHNDLAMLDEDIELAQERLDDMLSSDPERLELSGWIDQASADRQRLAADLQAEKATKFTEHMEPGENQREFVFTLPQQKASTGRFVVTDGGSFNLGIIYMTPVSHFYTAISANIRRRHESGVRLFRH
jgi:hypothetical protein